MSNYKEYQLVDFVGDIKIDIQNNIQYIENFLEKEKPNNIIKIILEKQVKYYKEILQLEDISRGIVCEIVANYLGWDPFEEPCLWDEFDFDMLDISMLYPNCKFVVNIKDNSGNPMICEFISGIVF